MGATLPTLLRAVHAQSQWPFGIYNRPRGGETHLENPLTTGVKKALPYRTGREAWYLPVSTEKNQIKKSKSWPITARAERGDLPAKLRDAPFCLLLA